MNSSSLPIYSELSNSNPALAYSSAKLYISELSSARIWIPSEDLLIASASIKEGKSFPKFSEFKKLSFVSIGILRLLM